MKIAADVRNLRRGQTFSGKITQIKQYVILIEIEDIGTGLQHISELRFDKDVFDFPEEDILGVKILYIDTPKNEELLSALQRANWKFATTCGKF